ncbi:MAG: hypothetical protein ACOX2I_02810 [Candidatus Ozemobacteraceae bacterium]|jgi:predicted Mrr-cat superfamily restriction endonuclease
MALWLVRSGRHGEYEQRFLSDNRIYLNWDKLNQNLSEIKQQSELYELLVKTYPDASAGKCGNHGGQIWAFTHRMQIGDLVVVPSKFQPVIKPVTIPTIKKPSLSIAITGQLNGLPEINQELLLIRIFSILSEP